MLRRLSLNSLATGAGMAVGSNAMRGCSALTVTPPTDEELSIQAARNEEQVARAFNALTPAEKRLGSGGQYEQMLAEVEGNQRKGFVSPHAVDEGKKMKHTSLATLQEESQLARTRENRNSDDNALMFPTVYGLDTRRRGPKKPKLAPDGVSPAVALMPVEQKSNLMDPITGITVPRNETPMQREKRVYKSVERQAMQITHVEQSFQKMAMRDETQSGWSPLMVAASLGDIPSVKMQLMAESQINFKSVDATKQTALMVVANRGNLEMVKLLVSHRAGLRVTNAKGQTALDLALVEGHTDVVEYLQSRMPSCSKARTSVRTKKAEEEKQSVPKTEEGISFF